MACVTLLLTDICIMMLLSPLQPLRGKVATYFWDQLHNDIHAGAAAKYFFKYDVMSCRSMVIVSVKYNKVNLLHHWVATAGDYRPLYCIYIYIQCIYIYPFFYSQPRWAPSETYCLIWNGFAYLFLWWGQWPYASADTSVHFLSTRILVPHLD